ncbi:unnamed protein product [Rotaria magnacalcarata]|uniref:Sodefrin-like factor n=1 Tax=Rotaria magnacalcarata TaxID=392030 RepID=A0A814SBR7_9BILA|nr:unnamed protein product [Rotaria magnacalcarata]CAF1487194.1 unnamed protein product [Rotaria magnacalcarata]CAF3890344.1 unnamed protein product [Rotaria magnacalcarata]CAF4071669.1 unnamed protein product [Rotaria magnacalcarata]
MLNLSCFVALLFLSLNHSISALSCYECQSTFPASSICLPPCTTRFVLDSTCVLMRNISLEPSDVGSLRAAHIGDVSTIPNITEKSFIFGEEAVYLNPSPTVGWDWEYGPITYGCDTNGCNEPGDVNRLPNALNARIPNATLERLLLGDLDNSCYVCNTCVDSDVTNTDMSNCTKQLCQSHACGFVATRNSPSSIAQCNAAWHYSSYCMGSREVAQVDMTLIYYIRSKSFYIYQMEAICLSNDCNNMTTFKQLKDAVTVDPDLTCLIDYSNSSTTTSIRPVTSTAAGGLTSTAVGGLTSTAVGGLTSTATGGLTSTSTGSPEGSGSEQIFINTKLFIFVIFSFYFIKF